MLELLGADGFLMTSVPPLSAIAIRTYSNDLEKRECVIETDKGPGYCIVQLRQPAGDLSPGNSVHRLATMHTTVNN